MLQQKNSYCFYVETRGLEGKYQISTTDRPNTPTQKIRMQN